MATDEELAPNPVFRRDLVALVGVLADLEGEIAVGEMPGYLADMVRLRLAGAGLTTENANSRELRQAIDDLNQRLRYGIGEYSAPPKPIPVPE